MNPTPYNVVVDLGSFEVQLTGRSDNHEWSEGAAVPNSHCSHTIREWILIYPGVRAGLAANPSESCSPMQSHFSTLSSHGASNFRFFWNTGDPAIPGSIPPALLPANFDRNNPPQPSSDPTNPMYGIFHPNPNRTFNHALPTDAPHVHWVLLQVDNHACSDIISMPLTVYPVPQASFTALNLRPDNSICPPEPARFQNTSAGVANTANTVYSWSFAPGIVEPIDFGDPVEFLYENINLSFPVQQTVTMTAHNQIRPGFICSSSASLPVFVNPQVRAIISGDTEGCSHELARFSSVRQDGGFIREWHWTFDGMAPDAHEPNAQRTFIHPTTSGQIDINVALTVNNGLSGHGRCEDMATHVYSLYPQPVASFTRSPEEGCQPLTVNFTNTSASAANHTHPNPTTGINYTFNFEEGRSQTVNSPFTVVSHSYENHSGAPRFVLPTLTATNEWGCFFTTAPQVVEVQPFVSAAFTAEIIGDDSCSPLDVRFRNDSRGFDRFTYNFGDGNVFSGTVATPVFRVHTFRTPTQYIDMVYPVTLTAWVGECSHTFTENITVLARPTAAFSPGPPFPADYLFPAPRIQLNNQIPLPARENLRYRWSWTESGSGDPPNNFSTAIYPVPLRITEWGRFDITQHVTAPNPDPITGVHQYICSNSLTRTINIVPPGVQPNFEDVDPACGPYTVTFVNTSRYAIRYQWDFDDGFTSEMQNPTHTFTQAGTYNVALTAIGHGGDRRTIRKQVVVHPTPQPNFQITPTFQMTGATLRAFNFTRHEMPDGSQYDIWYSWDWGDNSPPYTNREPSHIYYRPGFYNVTLTVGTYTEPQCIATKSHHPPVEIVPTGDLILPNAFRPLRPGITDIFGNPIDRDPSGAPSTIIPEGGYRNHLFFPGVLSPTREYSMKIFNRLGITIFETTNRNEGWNGYYRGRILEEGVYFYRIEGVFETGETFLRIGNIMLLW